MHVLDYLVCSIADLWSNVWGALVDDNFVNFAKLSKVFMTTQNLSITESRRKTDNEDKIFLYNSTQQP